MALVLCWKIKGSGWSMEYGVCLGSQRLAAQVLDRLQIGPGRSSLLFCQADTSQALTKWQAFHRSLGPLYEPTKIAKDMPEWSVLWPQLGSEKPWGRQSARVHGNDVRLRSETYVSFNQDNEGGVKKSIRRETPATHIIYLFIYIIDHIFNMEQCICIAEPTQLSIWQALFHA